MTSSQTPHPKRFSELMSPAALKLMSTRGKELVQQLGVDAIREVILDVLVGKNLRDSTEVLTRRGITMLNLATLNFLLNGLAHSDEFIDQLPYLASEILAQPKVKKSERWLAQWVLGLTDKAVQNVLRDTPEMLAEYREQYIRVCEEAIAYHTGELGELSGVIRLQSGLEARVDWRFMAYLLNLVGSQTLTMRGSYKSAYGKLFEKLVLGSLLHVLGFEYVTPSSIRHFRREFWLSEQSAKRESDATLLYEMGKGVRFDIGFIGRGNPEISLDKVSRFEREIEIGPSHWYLATIILVDRIGEKSRIKEMAERIGGTIIQMSSAYWPQDVARELNRVLGLEHVLLDMDEAEIEPFLREELIDAPLENFVGLNN